MTRQVTLVLVRPAAKVADETPVGTTWVHRPHTLVALILRQEIRKGSHLRYRLKDFHFNATRNQNWKKSILTIDRWAIIKYVSGLTDTNAWFNSLAQLLLILSCNKQFSETPIVGAVRPTKFLGEANNYKSLLNLLNSGDNYLIIAWSQKKNY